MSASQDFVALDWIKADISETLTKAQHSLETVAEQGGDASSMRACLTALHQVHGTLKMVEIEGPVLVASEMEALAQALMNDEVPDIGHAQELLMQTILQMPAYLDRIQREQQDNPQFVRPTVNNLRVSRGEEKLPGSAEADVLLTVFAQVPSDAVIAAFEANDGPVTVRKLRARYQKALAAVLKKQQPRQNLSLIAKVLQMLTKLCQGSPTGRFSEVLLAAVEGVVIGALKLDSSFAGQLRNFDSILRALSEGKADALKTSIPTESVDQMKGILDAANKNTDRIAAVKPLFETSLEEPCLTEEVEFGPDDDTVATVSRILIEELNGVTDRLDLYVRATDRQMDDLIELVPMMEQISSTLLVVGKEDHQQSILRQVSKIKELQAQGEAPSEDVLLDVAGALLEINADLNRLVGDVDELGETDSFGDLDEAQATVIRETRNGLARSKDAVIEYISNDFAKEKIEDLASSLKTLGSGLSIVNQQRCSVVLINSAQYVDKKLMGGEVQPTLSELDDLADAITSVDYFLERLLESTSDPYWQMVEVAEAAIAKLGFSVDGEPAAGEEPSAGEEPLAEIEPSGSEAEYSQTLVTGSIEPVEAEPAPSEVEASAAGIEPSADEEPSADIESLADIEPITNADHSIVEQPITDAPTETSASSELEELETLKSLEEQAEPEDDLIDDEILEIFIEESEDVLATLREYLPIWQSDPSNHDALTEVRRAFHTLKGSGRMVGATVVGELAWSVEDLLNRVLDNAIESSPALNELLSDVVAALPVGVEAFKDADQTRFSTEAFISRATAIASGEDEETFTEETVETLQDAEAEGLSDFATEANADVDETMVADEPSEVSFDELGDDSIVQLSDGSFEISQDASEAITDESLDDNTLSVDDLESLEDETTERQSPNSASVDLEGTLVESAQFETLHIENTGSDSSEGVAQEVEEVASDRAQKAEAIDSAEGDTNLGDVDTSAPELETYEFETDELETEAFDADTFDTDEIENNEPEASETEAAPQQSSDPELDAIFLEEAQENFELINAASLDTGDEVKSEAIAAYHTLKGSSAMAEIPSITTIAGPLESLLANLKATSRPMTNAVRELMSESLFIMRSITGRLEQQRAITAEHLAFVEKVESISLEAEDEMPLFEFQIVRKLSQAELVIADWEPTEVGALIVELTGVIEQAESLGHTQIVNLCLKLRDLYQKVSLKPAAAVVQALLVAHETLVHMFDELASSQTIRSADEAIALLDDLDIEALNKLERRARALLPFEHALSDLDQCIEQYSTGAVQEPNAIQSQLSRLVEFDNTEESSDQLDESLANTAELMLQLAEIMVDREAPAFKQLMACRDSLGLQIDTFRSGEAPSLDRELEAACKNTLRLSAAKLTPEAANLAPESTAESMVSTLEQPLIESATTLPEDDIDLDVLELFLEEAEELIEAIDESILSWSGDTGNTDHLANLLRHLHTIKGGARLAGLNSLGEYTHNFETFLTEVEHNPTRLDDAFFALLNSRQDEISRRIAIYNKLSDGVATADELESMRYERLTKDTSEREKFETTASDVGESGSAAEPIEDTQDDGLPEDDIDEDILPIFIEEAEELVESIDQCILEWSASPQETAYHDDLLRHLHTLKGGARLAGINSLGEFAHNFETYLIGIQQNPVPLDEPFFASLNQQQDEIHRRVDVYRKLSSGDASDDKLASLSDMPLAPVAHPSPTTKSEEPADLPAPTEAATSTQSQEMVRVSAELLEELIGLAGESNITRGRVEQQIHDFGESLQEMEETINRVRDQVRRLEIEAESRETVFRLANEEREGDSGFDDLEMDRYTMLQEISRTLNESSSDMLDLKETLTNKSRDAETLLHQQARIGTELQEGLTRTRMVPFARLIPRLRRIVRQISTEVGKSVRFDAFNVEGELDRNVLERIVAPLEHMLRNAVDHGIEDTQTRVQNNKPETGHITLRLSREGGYVVLTVSDDGGGINVAAVRRKAIERGLIRDDSDLSDHDIMQFIMHAGFSTAQKLTQISGRGVGMDVVNSEIKQLGGSISIDSTLGRGSEFTIQIPFTVSINRALLVVVREETYAVPLNTIEGIVRVSPYELEAYYQPDAPMFEYAGQPYKLAYMGKMLETGDDPVLEGLVAPLPVLLARSGDRSLALQVDRVIGSREIVSKSLGPQFNEVVGVSGATVMGDGSVVVILDVLAFVQKFETASESENMEVSSEADSVPHTRKIMIVDDSVTVRKVTSRLIERQGWEVTTAKDGLDAMSQLQDTRPDVVLLDIEMPKMDGFEVLKSVRGDARLEKLPIIMITSRTGEKHKQQAFDLGVNQYLGKPFQENVLLETIEEVLGAEAESSE